MKIQDHTIPILKESKLDHYLIKFFLLLNMKIVMFLGEFHIPFIFKHFSVIRRVYGNLPVPFIQNYRLLSWRLRLGSKFRLAPSATLPGLAASYVWNVQIHVFLLSRRQSGILLKNLISALPVLRYSFSGIRLLGDWISLSRAVELSRKV